MSSTGSHRAPRLAVIGGGQLARMMAQPAIALGLPLRLLAEAEGVSAAQVIPDQLVGDYTDLPTLRRVTEGTSVVTFDHEHVPTAHLHALEADGIAVRPGPGALVHAQDKAVMRRRLAELDVPCPRNAVVTTVADVEAFGLPCVLKTTRAARRSSRRTGVVACASRLRRRPSPAEPDPGVADAFYRLRACPRPVPTVLPRSPSSGAASSPG